MTNTQQETLHTGDKLAAMKAQKMWIFAALSAFAGSALAQWQWVGDDGRKVFSDLPPPAHIAPQKILKRPAGALVKPVLEAPERAAPQKTGAAASAAEQAAQQEQEAERKEQEAMEKAEEAVRLKAQAAKEKQEAAKLAQQRQINCQQAQAAQATLQSGRMLSHINEHGEQGFLSDEQRKQQLQRAQTVIKNECGAGARKS